MNIDSFLIPILEEWSMRVPHGGVRWDTSSREDMKVLLEIMIEAGIPEDAAEEWIGGLIVEAPDPSAKVTYVSTNGKTYTTTYQNAIKNKKDHPAYIAASKLRDGSPEEEEGSSNNSSNEDTSQQSQSDEQIEDVEKEMTPAEREKDIKDRAEKGDVAAILKVNADKEKEKKKESSKKADGKLTDFDDQETDGEIKQRALETGYRKVRGFTPAPGNSTSLFNEIMSGEGVNYLEDNPHISTDKLARWIYDQTVNLRAGKDLMGTATKRSGEGVGLNSSLYAFSQVAAQSARAKFRRSQAGKRKLTKMGIFEEGKTKTLNFYGHSSSLDKQRAAVQEAKTVYTPEGIEVPKEEVLDIIKSSGKKDNPSDTSTFVKDDNGNLMVMFHSDKNSTSDPQANSTPSSEYTENVSIAKKDPVIPTELSDVVSAASAAVKKDLANIEKELVKSTVDPIANVIMMDDDDFSTLASILKSNKEFSGKRSSVKTRAGLSKVTKRFMNLQKKVDGEYTAASKDAMKYLPHRVPSYDEEPPTEAEALMGFMNWANDNPNEVTVSQSKFLLKAYDKLREKYKSAGEDVKANTFDVSKKLEEIRVRSVSRQREYIEDLNKRTVNLPNGTDVPLGDYIEAKNVISKLHLQVIDPSESVESGVAKYKGMFSVNMGGIVVDDKMLKKCLGTEDTDDLITNFETSAPSGDGFFRNDKGEVTGNAITISSVTKSGKKKSIASKVQRSKKGVTGRLSTVYYWSDEMQNCFKKNG